MDACAEAIGDVAVCADNNVREQRGFHSHSMAHDPDVKKEIAEARKIAREDVNDAFE